MSLEPLHISSGRKFTAVLAAITAWINVPAGALIASGTILVVDPNEPIRATVALLAVATIIAVICSLIGQALIRLALGTFRTGGTSTRFVRYQFAALGVGGSLGIGFSPAFFDSSPLWWALGVAAGLFAGGTSLLLFRGSARQPLSRAPHPDVTLAEGTIVEHWSRSLGGFVPPGLSVVRYCDERGRARFVRHLRRQHHTGLGAIGQVQIDRRQPERVLHFSLEAQPRNIWHPGDDELH